MAQYRNEKIRKTLMKEISDIIQKKLNDSRIGGIVSITDLEIAHDNSYAKVYYSVFAPDDVKDKTIAAIEEDVPKIRFEVGRRIRLRLTPELHFILDDSLERGDRVTELINKISKGEIK
ncbi:MAG: 30S ribosome-binding factor RbfA [Candidatus Gastranaerophilales bacterium]|nr:30S ribosome-binding factor RbfA [Candidatus Gastranaerophilales bacterium]